MFYFVIASFKSTMQTFDTKTSVLWKMSAYMLISAHVSLGFCGLTT